MTTDPVPLLERIPGVVLAASRNLDEISVWVSLGILLKAWH